MENISKEKFQIIGVDKNEGERIARPHISYMQDAWRRFRQNKTALIAFIILVAIIFMCVFGPAISGYAFEEVDKGAVNKAPSSEHWFGTDKLGRDIFARVWVGGRVSMIIGLAGALISSIVGCIYGGVAAYFGGTVDSIMMRIVIIVSVTFAIPNYIFSEAFLSYLGLGIQPPNTSWGALANAAQAQFLFYPYQLFFPALMIALTMLSYTLMGDGLRDALDPKLRK